MAASYALADEVRNQLLAGSRQGLIIESWDLNPAQLRSLYEQSGSSHRAGVDYYG